MTKAHFQSVDEYIASQPDSVRPVLDQLRSAILKALPRAEEVISYNMPTYKLQREAVIYFASWKRHYSLYPSGDYLVAEFIDELGPYLVERGTIRFPLSGRLPVNLIEKVARFRGEEARCREREDSAT
jgi:uncharacterized protein YdhG (YjbR/CyaY superfamily)